MVNDAGDPQGLTWIGGCAVKNRLAEPLDGRERRFAIMRDVGHPVPLGLLAGIDLLSHLVDRTGQLAYFGQSAQGQSLIIATVRDRPRRRCLLGRPGH